MVSVVLRVSLAMPIAARILRAKRGQDAPSLGSAVRRTCDVHVGLSRFRRCGSVSSVSPLLLFCADAFQATCLSAMPPARRRASSGSPAPTPAANEAAAWAAKKRAQIAAARQLREEKRDGITEEHTFKPKRIARPPPRSRSTLETVAGDGDCASSEASPAAPGSASAAAGAGAPATAAAQPPLPPAMSRAAPAVAAAKRAGGSRPASGSENAQRTRPQTPSIAESFWPSPTAESRVTASPGALEVEDETPSPVPVGADEAGCFSVARASSPGALEDAAADFSARGDLDIANKVSATPVAPRTPTTSASAAPASAALASAEASLAPTPVAASASAVAAEAPHAEMAAMLAPEAAAASAAMAPPAELAAIAAPGAGAGVSFFGETALAGASLIADSTLLAPDAGASYAAQRMAAMLQPQADGCEVDGEELDADASLICDSKLVCGDKLDTWRGDGPLIQNEQQRCGIACSQSLDVVVASTYLEPGSPLQSAGVGIAGSLCAATAQPELGSARQATGVGIHGVVASASVPLEPGSPPEATYSQEFDFEDT
eukprot:TRINITY_DN1793_c0_g3_i1.p1 TRINITY_DN1793_c0_g3~~TRINITY_DN1793_c0_g3_i1.p1  ORF type:complete len:563 (-),score=123.25 TRINITY_DN1793_c0_g3_i1:26-1669(-)